jgi:hypothetical protein
MPRFTVKDLLIATTLIAIGAGAESFLIRSPDTFRGSEYGGTGILMLFGYCGAACIGAGLLLPFKRPLIGIVIGMVMQSLFIAVLLRTLK